MSGSRPLRTSVQQFLGDSLSVDPLFEGHRTVQVEGRWRNEPVDTAMAAGWYRATTDQPLGTLAAYLLEPASEDGVVTWNLLDRELQPGQPYPILRTRQPLSGPSVLVPWPTNHRSILRQSSSIHPRMFVMTARTAAHTRSVIHWLWEWTKSIVVALVVWFFLRTFLVEAFRIPSGSMENTLLIGDFLFVNKALYGAEVPLIHARLPAVREPQRNDILVFDSVEEEGLKVVKRLIGMPGDTLSMEEGELFRNGQRVNEPYAVHCDPTRSEDPDSARQDAGMAAPPSGRSGTRPATSPICRTGARSWCRPTRSS